MHKIYFRKHIITVLTIRAVSCALRELIVVNVIIDDRQQYKTLHRNLQRSTEKRNEIVLHKLLSVLNCIIERSDVKSTFPCKIIRIQ